MIYCRPSLRIIEGTVLMFHQSSKEDPNRQDVVRVWVDVGAQGELCPRYLCAVDPCVVHCLYH